VIITVSWTDEDEDEDETKSFVGETWTNGEIKILEPKTFFTNSIRELWSLNTDDGHLRLQNTFGGGQSYAIINCSWEEDGTSSYMYLAHYRYTASGTTSTNNLSTRVDFPTHSAISPRTGTSIYVRALNNNFFGTITTTAGITINWQRGPDGSSVNWKL
jgi:hypothetical protein